MKKLIFSCLVALSLSACNNNTPVGIAEKFLDCFVTQEYEKAKQYCSPNGVKALEFVLMMGGGQDAISGYAILRDSVVGDRAWVTYESVVKGEKSKTILELGKIDGQWKVDPKMRK
jgi:hypothetical protein